MKKVTIVLRLLLILSFIISVTYIYCFSVNNQLIVKADVSLTPVINSLSTNVARIEGGQKVIITGQNFTSDTKLVLGDTIISNFTINSETKIKFRVPPQKFSGAETLSVINKNGIAQSQFNIISKPFADLKDGEITTFLGGVVYFGDGLPASSNRVLFNPADVAVDKDGNIFFPDVINNRIRRIDATTSIITSVAGNGQQGFSGDGNLAVAASLNSPNKVIIDNNGNLFIVDRGNSRIRKVDNSGIITTVAGDGLNGFPEDGVLATRTSIYPTSLAFDSLGNLYFIDGETNGVRKVNATTKIITTVAGNGQQGFNGDGKPALLTSFTVPLQILIDKQDNIIIADSGNYRIRKVNAATRVVSTIAGTIRGFSGDGDLASLAMLDFPTAITLDNDGNLFIVDSGNNRIRKVDTTGVITTIAGNGQNGFSGDDGLAINASFRNPVITVDKNGDLLVADLTTKRLRKIDLKTNIISTIFGNEQLNFINAGDPLSSASLLTPQGLNTDSNNNIFFSDTSNRVAKLETSTNTLSVIAGTGSFGFSGDGEIATKVNLANPFGLTIDSQNNLFIADTGNNRIRKVDSSTNIITTVAGNGFGGFSDNLLATKSNLFFPSAVATDSKGNLFIADTINNRIRKVDSVTGVISTIVGNGIATFIGDGDVASSAAVSRPASLVTDSKGNIFIADTFNNRIRRIDAITGVITTIAGSDNQSSGIGDGDLAINASLKNPFGICLDSNGDIFVADTGNNRIRKISMATGIITSVAGNGERNFSGDGAVALEAKLNSPTQVAIDNVGNLFFADSANNRIRVVKAAAIGKVPRPAAPMITSATFSEPTLTIVGTGFGDNQATVIINKTDLSSRIGKQTPSLIVLLGDKQKLNLRKGKNKIIVKTSVGVSNTFVVSL